MPVLTAAQEAKLLQLGRALIDHASAEEIIAPMKRSDGFWFGAGTMIEGDAGELLLSGRYRSFGDSRTGLHAGERGVELSIFRASAAAGGFTKIRSFTKTDLSHGGRTVLSIEGSCLVRTERGYELFVSTEKDGIGYPPGLEEYQKPGTGVWTIDSTRADAVEDLDPSRLTPLVESRDPSFLHVKDPVYYTTADGAGALFFCTHPFSWTSASAALAIRSPGAESFRPPDYTVFPHGVTWDVAISRITDVVPVPALGELARLPRVSLVFYDGGESLRKYEEHDQSKRRPRGYSCEELGGLAYVVDDDFRRIKRLSVEAPAFVSGQGSGSSRYARVMVGGDMMFATWQQSMDDMSQPLMGNVVPMVDVERILS